jgi:dolichyl-phosphate-mannose-protein mannosyltransferase
MLGGKAALAALLAVALVLRVGLVATTTEYVPSGDAADYDFHAAYITEHGEYPPTALAAPGSPSAFRPPAYPHLLAAVYEVSGKRWTAGRLAGALLGTAAVLVVFLIGELAFGRRAGLAAGGLAAVFPPLVFLSGALVSENLFVPLVLGAVYAALRFRPSGGRLGWSLLAGALCGLAALTRTNGILVLLPVAIACWPPGRWRPRPRALAAPALAVLAALAVIAPWTVRNALAFGELVPVSTQSGYTLAGAWNAEAAADGPLQAATRLPDTQVPALRPLFHRPGKEEPKLDRELRRRAREFAGDHVGYLPEATRLNLLRMVGIGGDPAFTDGWNGELDLTAPRRRIAGLGLAILAALALLALARRAGRERLRRAPAWLWLVPLLLLASTVPLLGKPRYRAAVDPFVVLVAGVAVSERLWLRGARWTSRG